MSQSTDINKKNMLPNYRFSFFREKALCTRTFIGWISLYSIISGSRILKFCKKRPIPSDISIKLLMSAKNNVTNPILTLLGPQAPCNSFIKFFSGSFVFDINYEKL